MTNVGTRSIATICLRASLATASVTLIVVSLFLGASLLQETRTAWKTETERVQSVAPQIVRAMSGELMIGDERAARALLPELKRQHGLSGLELSRDARACDGTVSLFSFLPPADACVVQPLQGQKEIRFVVLRSHVLTRSLGAGLLTFLWIALPLIAFGGLATLLIRRELHRSIVGPVADLARNPESWQSNGPWVAREAIALHEKLLTYMGERDHERENAEALRLEASIGQMARQVAHDIQSPLAALDLAASHLDDLPEDDRILLRSAVARIRDIATELSSKHPKAETTTLAETGRATSETRTSMPSHEFIPQLLSSLIDPVISEKRLQFGSKEGREIESRLDGNSYGLFAAVDPKEFKRALSNLVNNAVEALNDGRGRIVVSLKATGSELQVCIEDDGCGIPKDVLLNLGERGFTYGKPGGSGLGLFHARTQVLAWGGNFKLESQEGRGTRVTLTLPRASSPAWFVPELKVAAGTEFVILDDDPSIHRTWERRFKALPANAVTLLQFRSAEALLGRHLGKKENRIYLLDYELIGEKVSGLDVAEQLELGSQAILVTSRYDERSVRERCERMGVRLIPKNLAAFVPISVAKAELRADLILIDDDKLVRLNWTMMAKEMQRKIATFASSDELENFLIDPATPIYVDKNLGTEVSGLEVVTKLHHQGFRNLYLATGENIPVPLPFLRGVIGKEFPLSS